MPSKTIPPPLSRSAAQDVLDWEDIEPRPLVGPKDVLGLRPEDRAALGLGAARTLDLAPTLHGDAQTALAELLQRGVAVGRSEPPRRKS